MIHLGNEVAQPSFKGDNKRGIKEVPCWTFVPLHHFPPPLLHILIGIWNDIWDKFREIVSELIEYTAQEEADLRRKKEFLLQKLSALRVARDSTDSKSIDSFYMFRVSFYIDLSFYVKNSLRCKITLVYGGPM